jgi:hypothetical protein
MVDAYTDKALPRMRSRSVDMGREAPIRKQGLLAPFVLLRFRFPSPSPARNRPFSPEVFVGFVVTKVRFPTP